MISKVDHLMGKVLAAIESEGLFDDTIVIFTSDHGDFAGQYGLWEKFDTTLADCLMHVPFAIAAPGLPRGARIDALTEHVDLAPTVLQLLGMSAAPQWVIHGESMLPALRGEKRKAAIFGNGGHEAPMRARFNTALMGKSGLRSSGGKQHSYAEVPDCMARATMIRTERWKLVMRETGGDELYDLDSDPWELNNRHDDTTLLPVRADLMAQLLRWRLRTDTDLPFLENVGA